MTLQRIIGIPILLAGLGAVVGCGSPPNIADEGTAKPPEVTAEKRAYRRGLLHRHFHRGIYQRLPSILLNYKSPGSRRSSTTTVRYSHSIVGRLSDRNDKRSTASTLVPVSLPSHGLRLERNRMSLFAIPP